MTDGFVFVSRYEAGAFAVKVGKPRKPLRIAPNGIQPEEFEPVGTVPCAGRLPLYRHDARPEGPDLFIEALALIRDRRGTRADGADGRRRSGHARYKARATALGLDDIAFHAGDAGAAPPSRWRGASSCLRVPDRCPISSSKASPPGCR